MNKEQLMALGLTEEQAGKVIAELDNEHMIPKSRLDEKIQEVINLNDQIKDRDKQLEDLKKVDAASLQAKIDELQTANETAKTDYEAKLKETQLTSALKIALNGKVHDSDLTASLINKETIELDDDGNIAKGLDEQLTTLQESKPFLFVQKEESKGSLFGFSPVDSQKQKEKTPDDKRVEFGKSLVQFSQQNKQLGEARDSYFK